MVTHNANLVVNTDADQIIVATSERTHDGGLPTISYESGSIGVKRNGGLRYVSVGSKALPWSLARVMCFRKNAITSSAAPGRNERTSVESSIRRRSLPANRPT